MIAEIRGLPLAASFPAFIRKAVMAFQRQRVIHVRVGRRGAATLVVG